MASVHKLVFVAIVTTIFLSGAKDSRAAEPTKKGSDCTGTANVTLAAGCSADYPYKISYSISRTTVPSCQGVDYESKCKGNSNSYRIGTKYTWTGTGCTGSIVGTAAQDQAGC